MEDPAEAIVLGAAKMAHLMNGAGGEEIV